MSQNNKYLDAIDNVLNVAQLAVPAVIPGANAARFFSPPQGYQNSELFKNNNTVFNVDRLANPVARAAVKAAHFLSRPQKYQNTELFKNLEDTTNGIYQGYTAGFSDELNGLGKGLVYGVGDALSDGGKNWNQRVDGTFLGGFKHGYYEGRNKSRADYDASLQRSPVLTNVGEIAGGFSNPLLAKDLSKSVKYLNELDTISRQTMRLLPTATAYGGLYGIGKSVGENPLEVGTDALIGGASAAPFALAGPLVTRAVNQGYIWNGNRLFKKSLKNARYKELDFTVPGENYFNSENALESVAGIPETMVLRKEPGIYYGRISKQKLEAINHERLSLGLEPIPDNQVFISPRAQHHIYERRIVGNRQTPEFVVDSLHSAIHKSPNVAYPTKFDNVQALVRPGKETGQGVFMGPNKVSGKLGPFSTHPVDMSKMKKLEPFK